MHEKFVDSLDTAVNPIPLSGAAIRVVIVDDRAVIRSALQILLERRPDFEVACLTSKDPRELAAIAVQPDVVLLNEGHDYWRDIRCLSWFRETMPAVRVLLLAETTDSNTVEQAIRLGAHGVVGKEHSADVLLTALVRVHSGEYWIDRAIAATFVSEACPAGVRRAKGTNQTGLAALTSRERDIVKSVADGLKNKEIALRLSISETTVRHHLTSVFAKLDVSDRLGLVIYAYKNGLVASTVLYRKIG